MVVTSLTAMSTASAVLVLSKAAWKLGISLSKLDQDTRIIDTGVKNLAGEVKSLGNECDLVYAELDEVINKIEKGSAPPSDVDSRMWSCLAAQVEETSRTIQELELFVNSVRGEETSFIGQARRQRKLDNSKDQIASIRTKICRHTDNLRTTLLLINTIFTHIAPCRADQGLAMELDKLQDVVEKLQRLLEANLQSQPPHTEATLLQYAREVIVKGTNMYEASLAVESVARGQEAANSKIRVVDWVSTLESIRQDQRRSDHSDMVSNVPSFFAEDEAHTVTTSATSAHHDVREPDAVDAPMDDSDNDLDTDVVKAALETGTKAFEAQEWEEADSLLQDALRVLRQLPKQQRAFCDIFGLQYQLAVCAYHTQESMDAEEALMSLIQQSANSDEQRGYVCDAAHLLSLLYIRTGQVERARSECEKALQARRRLLGKRSDAALESTALIAHIYVLLNNRARAKSYLAMIPEARRDAIVRIVGESLGTKVETLDSPSLLTHSVSEDSDLAVKLSRSSISVSSIQVPMEDRCYGPVSAKISQSPAASIRQSHQHILVSKTGMDDRQSITVTPLPSSEERRASRVIEKRRASEYSSSEPEAFGVAALSPGESQKANEIFRGKPLSRKEILDKIGCQPRDRIEEAVCNADYSGLASLLNKEKGFWRSKLRKNVRPERVTALHFAALFGEIEMARRLLASSFNINEIPFGYTTSLTPLTFAIGARQVDMVDFLIANGARPSEADSWSTLAGQLMNRSWLKKTMSEAEKEYVPQRMIAIFRTLLRHGWDVNAPFETSGATVLHQAVSFWTDSYRWDLNLRTAVASFLCERGADPFQANAAGKTPYDIASASGDQDLLLVLDRGSNNRYSHRWPVEPVELST